MSIEKNKKIKQTLSETKERRKSQKCYDWYVSGDTCEETFIEKASKYYKPKKTKKIKYLNNTKIILV